MTAASETRVGWCPGALRPMPSGDGLIVRVKPRGATLSPAQAIGIAAAASTFGNGALDLTSHANLQIRGASDASLPALTEALDRLGLLDPDSGAETRRNVTMSPLAGLDPEALLDIRPVVAALEDRLVADAGLAELPAKFGFAVSDGGRLPLGDVGADVMFDAGPRSLPGTGRVARSVGWGGREELHIPAEGFAATPPDTLRVPPSRSRGGITQPCACDPDRTAGFTVRLAGDAATGAFCPAQSVPDVAALLARWFIAARATDPDLRRMRHAVARTGAAPILAAVGLRAEAWLHPQPSWPGLSRPPTPTDVARGGEDGWDVGVGHLALRAGVGGRDKPGHDGGGATSFHVLSVAAPFDRLDAAELDTLARGALRAEAWLHPQPSWPGLSRPPTPTDVARSGKDGWDVGVGHLALRAGVGGRDKPGHDGGGATSSHVLSIAAPFGRLDAAQLDTLARGALRAGASELRLTPWRAILVPGLTRPAAERLGAACKAAGLVIDPGDPRLRVAACPGAPGCHRGTTPVLDHAARWAALLGPGHIDDGIVLHVSGCAKGCAHPGTAPLTLVAENGRYRLVVDGIPGSAELEPETVPQRLAAACEGRPR